MAGEQRNRMIDGWRGVSVLLVIASHLKGYRFADHFVATSFNDILSASGIDWPRLGWNVILRLLAPMGELGVAIFFVISGYLITRIMLREVESRGRPGIADFYVRRTFRILPAFFVFLLSVSLLSAKGIISVPGSGIIASGLFLCDFRGRECGWWLGHTWSLGVEEQFYLLWPMLFTVLGRWRVAGLLVITAALTAMSLGAPLALGFAHISIGALYAASGKLRELIKAHVGPWAICASVLVILLTPYLAAEPRLHRGVAALQPLLLAIVFFGTVDGKQAPFASIVSARWLGAIGLLSYSIYLWQQLFTGPASLYAGLSLLRMPLLLIVPAVLSYFIVERPLIRLGHRLSHRITDRRTMPLHPPSGVETPELVRQAS